MRVQWRANAMGVIDAKPILKVRLDHRYVNNKTACAMKLFFSVQCYQHIFLRVARRGQVLVGLVYEDGNEVAPKFGGAKGKLRYLQRWRRTAF